MDKIDDQAKRITEEQLNYYRQLRDPAELETIDVDILRGLYSELLINTEDIRKEHAMMIKFIQNNRIMV